MSSRKSGVVFAAAAVLFWLAWVLMPGVGVTDAEQVFQLVSSQRSLVAVSVVIQLASAALYVPALLGLLSTAGFGRIPGLRWSTGLLLVGAMGSAADAVLHLLAYAMTMPGLDRRTLIPVMAFMQGPGLYLLAPLLISFFAGGAALSIALARAGVVSRWSARLHGTAVLTALMGGALASGGFVPARAVGLTALGFISAAQVWVGVAVWQRKVSYDKPVLPRRAIPSKDPMPRRVVLANNARTARPPRKGLGPGSDRGQTRVRPGSDRGQTTFHEPQLNRYHDLREFWGLTLV